VQKTDNPLDLAVRESGYFSVQTPDGVRYTRDGSFTLDSQGQIVTQNGFPLLSTGGQPIIVSPNDGTPEIAHDGTVSTQNGMIGKIGVVSFDNPQDLMPTSGGLFSTDSPSKPVQNPVVLQGMLEGSNIQPVVELTHMIDAQRSYESAHKLINAEDDRIKKMVGVMAQTV
jgi:flagellar basal-body rod protein FlgF